MTSIPFSDRSLGVCVSRLPMVLGGVSIAIGLTGCGRDAGQSPVNSAAVTSTVPTQSEVVPDQAAPDDPATDTSTDAVPASDEADTKAGAEAIRNATANLERQLAAFEVPPEWIDAIEPKWDTAKPWSEARQEIRRLLGQRDDVSRREGIKLTWVYLQKKDIGDGHEYGTSRQPRSAIKSLFRSKHFC